MTWRVAKSLDKLLEQINVLAPIRNKASDGSIGDIDHSNRTSDHNPYCGPGVVTARDFTHDPTHKADMSKISNALRKSKDHRIKYVIFNSRIFSSTVAPWQWRAYTGPNPHTKHMHVSVICEGFDKDDTKPWKIETAKVWRIIGIKRIAENRTGWKAARRLIARLRKRGFKVTKKRVN